MVFWFWDEAFSPVCAPRDDAVSVVWSLRYGECGTFTAVFPAPRTAEEKETLDNARFFGDREYAGRIESIRWSDGTVRLRGRLLECLLFDRVLPQTVTVTGTAGEMLAAVLAAYSADGAEPIPAAECLPSAEALPGLSETGEYQVSRGENLGEWLYAFLPPRGCGIVLTRDTAGAFRLSFPVSAERSLDGANDAAVFSEEFGNVAAGTVVRDESIADVQTCVLVEGGDGVTETVDETSAGARRREGYLRVPQTEADFANPAAYRAALRQAGTAYLAKRVPRRRVTCTAEEDAAPRYGISYRLGDICELRHEALRIAVRLTELDIVYENGARRLYPFFGDTIQTLSRVLETRKTT